MTINCVIAVLVQRLVWHAAVNRFPTKRIVAGRNHEVDRKASGLTRSNFDYGADNICIDDDYIPLQNGYRGISEPLLKQLPTYVVFNPHGMHVYIHT